MHTGESGWTFTEDFHVGVNFCVWVLRLDGLHVGPFTQHPDGDGKLRNAGLTARGWLEWVSRIIGYDQQVRGRDITAIRPGRKYDLKRAHDPVGAWFGPTAVRGELSSLWIEYEPGASAWRLNNIQEVRKAHGLGIKPDEYRKLWATLTQYQSKLPGLRIFLVDYPSVVLQPIPPISAVVGMGERWYRDSQVHASTIINAAQLLTSVKQ